MIYFDTNCGCAVLAGNDVLHVLMTIAVVIRENWTRVFAPTAPQKSLFIRRDAFGNLPPEPQHASFDNT